MGKNRKKTSRRQFLRGGLEAAAAFTPAASLLRSKTAGVPRHVLGAGATPPSDKLNIACIGVGGRGGNNLKGVSGENIVALCDVDMRRAARAFKNYPNAKHYRDFRKMLDEMDNQIDAVLVSTPDHTHAVAAMEAIRRGKHVYCEKPLAHSIYEVRKLTEAARKYKVATQMGNQGHSSEHIRLCCEWVADGAIGNVRQVHAWSNRPMGGYAFPSGLPRPKDAPPVPDTLNWDLWLGPAEHRPYHPAYAPIYWRGWLDFGTGALGDMGCHILDPAFWALRLGSPVSVEANTSYNPNPEFWMSCFAGSKSPKAEIPKYLEQLRQETHPVASIVRYEFPARPAPPRGGARGDMPPVMLTWFDGGMLPPRPEGMEKGHGGNGAFIIGDKGVIRHGSHGANGCRIIPESKMKEYLPQLPPKTIKRVKDHHQDWLNACKGGDPASSSFDYGGPLTEMVLLGIIAMRFRDKKLLWNADKMEFTNSKDANELVKPAYRQGWTL